MDNLNVKMGNKNAYIGNKSLNICCQNKYLFQQAMVAEWSKLPCVKFK